MVAALVFFNLRLAFGASFRIRLDPQNVIVFTFFFVLPIRYSVAIRRLVVLEVAFKAKRLATFALDTSLIKLKFMDFNYFIAIFGWTTPYELALF